MVDKKLTELDAITGLTTDDLLYIVDAPGTTPVSKKVAIEDFLDGLSAQQILMIQIFS